MVTSFTVNNEADLNGALLAIDQTGTSSAPNTAYTITLAATSGTLTLNTDLYAVNLATGDTLTVDGASETIDGQGAQRGFMVLSGSVTLSDLILSNLVATGGAGGTSGGGGGAGLGGALFVAGTNVVNGVVVTTGGAVNLINVGFSGDQAVGGAGGDGRGPVGGGGGMGGAAGTGTGGGGGGIGSGATGASGGLAYGIGSGSAGIVPGGAPGGGTPSGNPGTAFSWGGGGAWGGGGGYRNGGGLGGFLSTGGFGGGGNGQNSFGGKGGFGGGGGGTGETTTGGGTGGFGGGGGSHGGVGGFGGGNSNAGSGGAGGLGAGGDVFVQQGASLTIQSGTLAAGIVNGGTGGATGSVHAASGGAFGNGIFLQGNETIALAPTAGQTLTIAGVIADQSGSGGTGANAGAGGLSVGGGGTVALGAANSFTGGIAIDGGSLILSDPGAAGSGAITFAGPGALTIDSGTPGNIINGFGPGDTVDFAAIAPGSLAATPSGQNTLIGGVTFAGSFAIGTGVGQVNVTPDGGGGALASIACFAAGTGIVTGHGTVAVEALRIGDRVRTLLEGGLQPIVWIGRRHVDCRRHQRPGCVWPVRVAAGALGPGRPARAVFLSPDHAVYLAEVLVPVKCLINGTSITQRPASAVTYYHIELARHEVLLADGLPAESFLDTGNRAAFANNRGPTAMHPDFSAHMWEAESCAPLVVTGPRLAAALGLVARHDPRRAGSAFPARGGAPRASVRSGSEL